MDGEGRKCARFIQWVARWADIVKGLDDGGGEDDGVGGCCGGQIEHSGDDGHKDCEQMNLVKHLDRFQQLATRGRGFVVVLDLCVVIGGCWGRRQWI